jgi:hypothetical protein
MIMSEEELKVLKHVYSLAKDRRIKNEKAQQENIKTLDEDKEMYTYLEKLDHEKIKMIQTLMYLGKDKNFDNTDSPEIRYKKEREYMDEIGWKDKELDIKAIEDKEALDLFLKSAFEILNIKL